VRERLSLTPSYRQEDGSLECGAATAQQVEDQHYHCNNQQQVDQSSAYVTDQAQQPQNEMDYYYCPKHFFLPP
jgi:hypothetical protein